MHSVRQAFKSVVEFIIGFMAGVVIEYAAIMIYKRWDTSMTSKIKISLISLAKLFILFLISQTWDRALFLGLFSAQVLTLDYVYTKFYNPLRNLE